jgi:Flp pilus assembly protein TadG
MKSKFRFSLLSRLGKDKNAPGPRLLARLLRDEEGSYLILGAATFPILIGVAGLATEGGLAFYNHRALQNAADAAAYSAAIAYSYDSNADVTTQAKALVASYGFTLGTGTNQANVTATATTFATQPAIVVNISRPQTAIFSSIYSFSVISNGASATAVLNGGGNNSGNCLVAMGMNPLTGTNDAPSTIGVQGNPTIDMGTCGVFSNSTDCTPVGGVSVALGGNATLRAGSVGSAGCISVTGSSEICTNTNIVTCSPPAQTYTQNDGRISDPYAGVTIPTTGTAGSCSGGTCSPGVYNGDLANNVTLQPGVYIFTNGLTVKNSTVTGTGVTLVFTSATPGVPSSYKGFSFEANAKVTLTAPTTGPTAGFVMMGDRNMPYNTPFSTQSNPTVNLSGTVYLPNAALDWQGGPDWPDDPNHCLQMIVNKITMQGNPGITTNNCSGGLLPGQKAIGSKVTLVQ